MSLHYTLVQCERRPEKDFESSGSGIAEIFSCCVGARTEHCIQKQPQVFSTTKPSLQALILALLYICIHRLETFFPVWHNIIYLNYCSFLSKTLILMKSNFNCVIHGCLIIFKQFLSILKIIKLSQVFFLKGHSFKFWNLLYD